MDKYIHINYMPNATNWLLKIIARLQKSDNENLKQRFRNWENSQLSELGIALTTKLSILLRAVSRVNQNLLDLSNELKNSNCIDKCIQKDTIFAAKNKNLPYDLLLAVDSFYYESRSAYEITGLFIKIFCEQILDKKIGEEEIKIMLIDNKVDVRWIDELRDKRILFFHNTAPWIALQVVSINPPKYELVILKRSSKNISVENDYILFKDLRSICDGFVNSMNKLQMWILREIEIYEEAECK